MTPTGQKYHRITIDIAGFVVSLETDDGVVAERIRLRYHEFLAAEEAAPLVTVELRIVPGALYIEPEPGPWVIESSFKDDHLTYKSYLEMGEVDLQAGRGYLEMAPEAHVENLLRVIYAWICLQNNAVLLHAAGVIRDGLGYVFFGPSGAGKTTTSRLAAKKGHVVSDDLVIVRCGGDGCTLYGVPFKGELSEAPRANQQAPLQGIYRLRQDTDHFLEPLPGVTAVAQLVAAAPFVVNNFSLNDLLFSVVDQIVRKTAVQQLHFKRDDGFWEIIRG